MSEETFSPAAIIKLNETRLAALREEIAAVIEEHRADVAELTRNIIIQRRLYEMRARKKSWPWPGASNAIVPIIRYVADYYKSRIVQVFRPYEDIWMANVIGPEVDDQGRDWKRMADNAAKFLEYVCDSPEHVDFNNFVDEAADGFVKDGTVVVKPHFVDVTPTRVTASTSGKPNIVNDPPIRRVAWDVLQVTRTTWTTSCSEIPDMPVFGHWTEMTRSQFERFASANKLKKEVIDKVIQAADMPWFVEEERLLDEDLGVNRETQSKTLRTIRIHELYVEFPIADDEPPALLGVWWHHTSQQILAIFDPSEDRKPFEVIRFVRRGRQFLGATVMEGLRGLNLVANTVTNQTVDSQTVANAHGFTYKASSITAEYVEANGIFPACKIPIEGEDVRKDFGTFQLGSTGTPVSLGLINFILGLVEMVGKVGGPQQGQVSTGSRVAASVGMSIMQEGSQMVDAAISRFRDTIKRLGLRTLYLYANHAPEVFNEVLSGEEATELLTALRYGGPLGFKIDLKVASASANKEKDKQDLIVYANFIFGVYDRISQTMVPIITNPMVPPEAKQLMGLMYKGMSEVITRLTSKFEQFKDPSAPLPPEIGQIIDALAGGQQPAMFPRVEGVPGAPGGGGQAALGPAATGGLPPEAAMLGGLLQGLGGGMGNVE